MYSNSTVDYKPSHNNNGDFNGNINVVDDLYNFLCNIYIGDNAYSLYWRLGDDKDPIITHDNANNNIGIQHDPPYKPWQIAIGQK